MLDLSVVIVSYNVRDLLGQCLESVYQTVEDRTVEVIVVDNGSRDGTVETVAARFPEVRLLANSGNPGFGAANNQAFSLASGRALLYLNPDAELRPGALSAMLDYLDAHPDVAVVGPRTFYPNGAGQSTRRRFPTPLTALVESTRLQRLGWIQGPLARYYVADRSDSEEQDVDWLVGACLMVRRSVMESVGGFDERFFMYSEELDLCQRIRQRGWRIVYLPNAEIIHHEGRSSEQNLARRALAFNESKCRYFEKHFGAPTGRALRLYLLANTVGDLAEESLKFLIGHRRELREARIRQLWQVAVQQGRRLGGMNLGESDRGGGPDQGYAD